MSEVAKDLCVIEDDLELVATSDDYRTDWRKRLRELREIGIKYETRQEEI